MMAVDVRANGYYWVRALSDGHWVVLESLDGRLWCCDGTEWPESDPQLVGPIEEPFNGMTEARALREVMQHAIGALVSIVSNAPFPLHDYCSKEQWEYACGLVARLRDGGFLEEALR